MKEETRSIRPPAEVRYASELEALAAVAEGEVDLRSELQVRLEYYQRSEPWRE